VQFLYTYIDKPICRLADWPITALPIAAIPYFAALDTSNRLIKMGCGQSAIRLVILPNHIKFRPIRAIAVIADWLEGATFEIRALYLLQEYLHRLSSGLFFISSNLYRYIVISSNLYPELRRFLQATFCPFASSIRFSLSRR
jgi:hypothetical protein